MVSHLRIYFPLFAIILLPLGCGKAPQTESHLKQFWQYRPASGNPLELAGYDRSFAQTAAPAVIDAMIADLQNRSLSERFEIYAIVAYYMPRPASIDRLAKLQQSPTDATSQWAGRFLQRFRDLDGEIAVGWGLR
jgi:hypothetical protein